MFGTLELTRTNEAHIGASQIRQMMPRAADPAASLHHIDITVGGQPEKPTFRSLLLDAVSSLNEQQNDVSRLQKQLITDPDSVDIHDVTISMAKAQMSLSLAQSVADRIIKGWSEVTTTR